MSAKGACQKASQLVVTILLILACSNVVLPAVSGAQDEFPWRGEYYNNVSLMGDPVLIRNDRAIDFDWGHNRPADGLPVDHFSVRWTALLYFEGGTYSFKTYTDDGVRLWLDGQLLIDQWRNQPATRNERQVDVSPGYHSLRMEYYENIGIAIAMLWWDRLTVSTTTMRWRAEYFNNPWLVGAPVLVREENDIRYNWGKDPPAPGVVADGFSVRWTGTVGFDYSDTYTFTVTVDDGARVWIDDGLLIDAWRDQSTTTVSVARYVTKGPHP
ncbi:MAG: PA14 domain-containing protein, partial [Candidatus Hadarchaeum sp.]